MRIALYIAIAIGFLLLLIDLRRHELAQPSLSEEVAAPAAAAEPSAAPPAQLELGWDAPATWLPGTKSSMRLGSYTLKATVASGEEQSADLSIIKLRGDGGGDLPNLNRWRAQVGLPAVDAAAYAKEVVVLRGRLGAFTLAKIINSAKPEAAILGAMAPAHGDTVYVKLSGTAAAVEKLAPEFTAFVKTLHFIGDTHEH